MPPSPAFQPGAAAPGCPGIRADRPVWGRLPWKAPFAHLKRELLNCSTTLLTHECARPWESAGRHTAHIPRYRNRLPEKHTIKSAASESWPRSPSLLVRAPFHTQAMYYPPPPPGVSVGVSVSVGLAVTLAVAVGVVVGPGVAVGRGVPPGAQ